MQCQQQHNKFSTNLYTTVDVILFSKQGLCVLSPSSTMHVHDRGTPLMMRSIIPPCSLHGRLTACSALLHLTLWHGHRYGVVTSSCLSRRGHASRRGCHIPTGSGTSNIPVSAAASICSVRECATPCLPSPAPWDALRMSPTVARATPIVALWDSCRPLPLPARPPGCCPSSGRHPSLLVMTLLGGTSPTSALQRPRQPTTAVPSARDAFAVPAVSPLTPPPLARCMSARSTAPLSLRGALPHTAPAPHPAARLWCYLPTSPGAPVPPTTCH